MLQFSRRKSYNVKSIEELTKLTAFNSNYSWQWQSVIMTALLKDDRHASVLTFPRRQGENVIIIYREKKSVKLRSVKWILQYKGVFYFRNFVLTHKFMGKEPLWMAFQHLPLSILHLSYCICAVPFPFLFPWLLFSLASYFSSSQSSAFEVAGPQVGSPDCWQNRTGDLTGNAYSKQPSAPGPEALNGADGREGAPSFHMHKAYGGSGS